MQIKPVINGVIARTAHPYGCQAAILQQIAFVQHSQSQIKHGPKRVLIIGASSGFGLASRIALAFGGSEADTIGVSLEHAPSQDKGVGSAGWYNNIFFQQEAQKAGRIAININGDAFSTKTKDDVVEAIETYFEGEVDLVIYSLAAGSRSDENGNKWRSCIKPIGDSLCGASIMLENDQWVENCIEAASDDEIDSTIKVMGGADWESWIDTLINADSIAEGCQTVSFSYIGSELNSAIYRDGTLGWAKVDLHQTSHALNFKLAHFNGAAYTSVCKALVTKASVFIPTLTPYLIALYKVMKEQDMHEDCIAQMQRLFSTKLYGERQEGLDHIPVDLERLIRMDDWEMSESVQHKVADILAQMDQSNFMQLGDYEAVKHEFLALNGFGFELVDYDADISLQTLMKLGSEPE